jgi:hypothetical protein
MNANARLFGCAAFLLALAACGTSPSDIRPPWLAGLIEAQLAEPVANPPARIVLREYESGVYYYLPPRCCDIWSELYDADGTLICHPDGGITGDGDGQCPALGALLREEVVWSDPRA